MPPELAAALSGLLSALTALVWAELRFRQARDRARDAERRLVDVQHKVGADRRGSDS
jgi:hypothetical protein